jgi:transcription termination factor Rho
VVDEAVLEEIDGAANSVLRLQVDENQQVFPAVDIAGSRTNHEELLLDEQELDILVATRRALVGRSPQQVLDTVGGPVVRATDGRRGPRAGLRRVDRVPRMAT